MSRTTAPLLLLAAAACGGGAPAARTVRIDTADTYASGPHAASDASEVFVEAHTKDGIIPAEPQPDGSFTVGVPAQGDVWLRVVDYRGDISTADRGDLYVLTSADEVHIGRDLPGKADTKLCRDAATTLELDGGGLDAWQFGDELDMAVPGSGLSRDGAFTYNSDHNPNEGDSTLAVQLKWATLPLADDSPVWLSQVRGHFDDPSGVMYASPVRAARGQLTQPDGAQTKLQLGFEAPPALNYTAMIARSEFARLRPQINPWRAGPAQQEQLYVHAVPGGADRGEIVPHELTVVNAYYVPGDKNVDTTFTVPATNPYPAEWLVERYVQTFPVLLAYKDGVAQNQLEGELGFTRTTVGAAIKPMITPPRDLRLGGVRLDEDVFSPHGDLSWKAPEGGTPTSYEVTLYGLYVSYDLGERLVVTRRGTLFTPGDTTTITFPHDLVQPDHTYAVCVRAVSQPGQDVTRTPLRGSANRAWADTCSSLLYY